MNVYSHTGIFFDLAHCKYLGVCLYTKNHNEHVINSTAQSNGLAGTRASKHVRMQYYYGDGKVSAERN